MAANFDPYHAWLGIPPGPRPLNHYQLLGLAPFTSEPPIIAEAIEDQTARLEPFMNGGQAGDALRIAQEIQAAKAALLTPANKRAYDAELRRQLGMPALPESKTVGPAPTATPTAAPAVAAPVVPQAVPVGYAPQTVPVAAQAIPYATAPAQPMMGTPVAGAVPTAQPYGQPAPQYAQAVPQFGQPVQAFGQPAPQFGQPVQPFGQPVQPFGQHPGLFGQAAPQHGVGMDEDDAEEIRYRRRQRQSSSGTLAFVGLGVAAVVLLGAVCFAYRGRLLAALDLAPEEPPMVQQPEVAEKKVSPEKPHSPKPEKPEFGPLPTTAAARMVGKLDPPTGRASPPKMAGRNPPQMADASKTPPPTKPKPAMTKPKAAPAAMRAAAAAEEKAAVTKSLAEARKALGMRDTKKVSEQFDLATLSAASTESMTAIDRMRTLDDAVGEFWNAVRKGLQGLKPVDELEVDGKKMVVINADIDGLSVRSEGQAFEYQINKRPGTKGAMPASMAYFLATSWLKEGDPSTKVLLGAFLSVDPNGDPDKGRKFLEEAGQQGNAAAKVLLELN